MLYLYLIIFCFLYFGSAIDRCGPPRNNTYPLEDNVTESCYMTIHESDKDDFVHNIIMSNFKLNFWTLSLQFTKSPWNRTRCVIQPLHWVWTFPGEYGAVRHLHWPESSGIWSFGILSVDLDYIPKIVRLYVHGNCSVTLGETATTERIGLALIQMANNSELLKEQPEIEYSYFCYTEQIWIQRWLYYLCLHLVCPLRSMGRKCCRTVYEYETRKKRVVCEAKPLQYADIWWQYPYVIGIIMFAYFPLLLLRVMCIFSFTTPRDVSKYGTLQDNSVIPKGWLLTNPISLWNLFKLPLLKIYSNHRRISSKIIRVILVCLSLSVIATEVIVSYRFEYDYVLEGVNQGVPMNFLSLLAGYNASKRNFLYYYGGPYVALPVYVVSLSLLLCVPKSFSSVIENGIGDNSNVATSLLTLDLKTTGKLGGTYNLHQLRGTDRFFCFIKSHLYMLISQDAIIMGFRLQAQRLRGFINIVQDKSLIKCFGLLVLIPIYIFVCILEWIVIIVYFFVPIFPFFLVIIRGFWASLRIYYSSKLFRAIFFPFIVFLMMYNIYIFSIVFVASFLFLSRIFIFTLTGFIAFPNETYAYLVFFITITMYIVENAHSVRSVYDDYFLRIHEICSNIADRKLFPRVPLVSKQNDTILLSTEVFTYVIKRHRPVKIDVCYSLTKICFIIFVLFLAISMIVSFQSFQTMESLTQVATVLFICLIPKLWKKLCHTDKRFKVLKENAKIRTTIEDYCRQKLFSKTKNLQKDQTSFASEDDCANLLTPVVDHSDESGDELLFDPL